MEFDGLVMNKYGRPVPQKVDTEIPFLMPRVFTEWIAPQLKPDMDVFEFGAGRSTLYLARRVKRVVSIEYHRWWWEALRSIKPPNVYLRWFPPSYLHKYAEAIIGTQNDIIFVDGMRRGDCLLLAREALKPGGLLILDDAQWEAIEEQKILLSEGWTERIFRDGTEKHASVFTFGA